MKPTNKDPLSHLKSRSVSAEYLEAAKEFADATHELSKTIVKLDLFLETEDENRCIVFETFGNNSYRSVVRFTPEMELPFKEFTEAYRKLVVQNLDGARARLNQAAGSI